MVTREDLENVILKLKQLKQDIIDEVAVYDTVTTYDNLPDVLINNDTFVYVEEEQGDWWLPESEGGNYYAKGFYYSDGVQWVYAGEIDIQGSTVSSASQITVDAGLVDNEYISPLTLKNSVQWSTKANTAHTHPQSDITNLTTDLANKQDALVSGTNIKSVNGSSLLGVGDLTVGVADGLDTVLFVQKRVGFWLPVPNSSSSNAIGFTSPVTTGFSLQTRIATATNLFTRSTRVGYQTIATTGQVGQFRAGQYPYTVGDSTTNLGGFTFIITFGISDPAAVATARMFMGMRAAVIPTNVEPSTITDCIGIGHGAADTNLKLFYGGSTPQTPIDLGSNFPITHGSVNVYKLALYSAPNSGDVDYKVTRVNTGHVASGTIVNTGATVLPTNTTYLNLWGYRSNNNIGAIVAIDVMKIYVETDY